MFYKISLIFLIYLVIVLKSIVNLRKNPLKYFNFEGFLMFPQIGSRYVTFVIANDTYLVDMSIYIYDF